MREFKGTKGEWKLVEVEDLKSREGLKDLAIFSIDRVFSDIPDYPYQMICLVSELKYINKEDLANAKLIASAPDLLKALQLMVNNFKYDNLKASKNQAILKSEKAISKALD